MGTFTQLLIKKSVKKRKIEECLESDVFSPARGGDDEEELV